ncbi:MAG: hypothetical protein BGO81_10920 [Devosia sp. 66-22]|nr:MAG: hypothetical protein BGO81_10920 [Devosia sp. 66-22]
MMSGPWRNTLPRTKFAATRRVSGAGTGANMVDAVDEGCGLGEVGNCIDRVRFIAEFSRPSEPLR